MKEKGVIVVATCNWDRQQKMLIISSKDDKNNRWKRNEKKKENRKRGTEAIAKGWEINDFVGRLS